MIIVSYFMSILQVFDEIYLIKWEWKTLILRQGKNSGPAAGGRMRSHKRKGGSMEMLKEILAGILSAAVLAAAIFPTMAAAKPETLDNGYEIDLENLPKVHFGGHPEWEALFDATWESLTTTIKKANANLNSKEPYYLDKARAFSSTVFAWDTMFTLMFAKYAYNEFPILAALDTFYEHQTDNPGGEDDGYIPREINQESGKDAWSYDDVRSMNPPLWAWAEWDLYQVHGDVNQFSRQVKGMTVYERMKKHYQFIERYKKLENGLYGKTNGYGNGLDNTFNQGAPYAGNQVESNGNQTFNDLSLQQAQFAYYLAKIAGAMGNEEDEAFFTSEHERISALIIEKMWDEDAHMFSNLDADGVTHTNESTPTTLWALAAHVATEQQAAELIQYHGQNSQKLYRPYGLATAAYDNPGYVPGGDYWRGSFWGPTSYQYIKGLEEYGYDEIALEESIRHMTSILGVWQAGLASGVSAETNPLWENYSSEYLKRGSNSNPDYGWIGTVSVGVMIEDILGFKPHAAENTVNWSIRLTEEHGIDDLRYIHNGVENIVSFMAEKRESATDPVTFSVIAKEPFTLIVSNGDITQTYDVQAGVNLFAIDGESGEAPTMSMRAGPLDDVQAALTPARFEAAEDAVLFGAEADASIYDGLQYQDGKKAGLIRNVNTIGYSSVQAGNPPRYQGSDAMQELGFAGAREVVKNYNSAGNEGFMFTVPAGNRLRTLTAIVGVQNGTAQFTADVTDASSPTQTVTLTGGSQESVYVVEVPYRASKDGYHVLVKYTVTSPGGSVSLKGILLEEGGAAAPANVTLTPAAGAITVDAEAMMNTPVSSWNIYGGSAPDTMEWVACTGALPYTLDGLTNGEAYYIALESVAGGVTSIRSQTLFEVPEEDPIGWDERVRADLEAALPVILNGNTGSVAKNRFIPVSVGPLYHSDITFAADTDGAECGINNAGYVIPPTGHAVAATVTVTAAHGSASASRQFTFTVLPVDVDGGDYAISSDPIMFTGTAYLSSDGETDWMQVIQPVNGVNPQAKKAGGSGIGVPVFDNTADPTGGLTQSNNSGLGYTVTDAGDPAPVNNRVFEMRGVGNAIEVPLSYSGKVQRVFVYFTLSRGTARIDLMINGQIRAGETATYTGRDSFRLEFDFAATDPAGEAAIRLTLTDAPEGSNSWAALNAVTLQETDTPYRYIPQYNRDPSADEENIGSTDSFSGTLYLTKQGTLDWIQTPDAAGDYAKKQGGVGLSDFRKFTVAEDANNDHQASVDGDIYYAATDSDPTRIAPKDRCGVLRRGEGNGVEFTVEPAAGAGKRLLKVYTGNYKAGHRLEYIVNGETVYEYLATNDNKAIFCTTIVVDLQPGDEAVFRQTLVDQYSYGDPNGCSIMYAATLGEYNGIDRGTTLPAEYLTRRVRGDNPRIEGSNGKDIGYLNKNMWISYNIDMEAAGVYDLTLEYSTGSTGSVNPGLVLTLDGQPIAAEITSLAGTGGWTNWMTYTLPVELPAGPHTLKLDYTRSGPNLKSIRFLYRDELDPIDKTALQELASQARAIRETAQVGGAIGEYPQEAAGAFDAAIQVAEAVLDSGNMLQVQVDGETAGLQKAMTAFQYSKTAFVKDGLNTLIKRAEGLDMTGCTAGSVTQLQKALVLAQRTARESRVTQEQVEAVQAVLQAAMDGLQVDSPLVLGDVDGSGGVTAADALLTLQISTGKITPVGNQRTAADVDGTPGVTAADALLILQYATQKISSFS